MIGVHSPEKERETAAEFFELFKTPWEFLRKGVRYPVALVTHEWTPDIDAQLVIVYNGGSSRVDRRSPLSIDWQGKGAVLRSGDLHLPIYGNVATYSSAEKPLLTAGKKAKPAAVSWRSGSQTIIRVGYDLFQEVNHLLTKGQPPIYANIPTLEVHIALLRGWILQAGIPLLEIPPTPAGCDFMVCLTHDVDFAGIRHHRFDHTMAGFLYRALFGSGLDLLRGKCGWRKLLLNWGAVLTLPAVYAGLARDLWLRFEQYLELEKAMKSTFYFIPFKGRAGARRSGTAPARRGTKYDISDVKGWVERIRAQGCEVGLHGIDAWKDARSGKEELQRIRDAVGESDLGVRMHWLYFGADSPKRLEEAGFLYDSTWGYNETVGFRAGTGQVFRPSGARSLLELPLIVQDTALFTKGRMGLGETDAMSLCRETIGRMKRFGGALVINWHHRSIAPERLWDGFYKQLLQEVGKNRVRFLTARGAVQWFQQRRSVQFERSEGDGTRFRVKFHQNGFPSDWTMAVRVHQPSVAGEMKGSPQSRPEYSDIPLRGEPVVQVCL